MGTTVGTVSHRTTSITTTDNRSGPICFRCGERGHLRFNCTERVFCDFCKTLNHSPQACRKQPDNTPSPTGSQITTGYHPTATVKVCPWCGMGLLFCRTSSLLLVWHCIKVMLLFGGTAPVHLKVREVKCVPRDPATMCPVLFKGSHSLLLLA